MHGSSGSAQCNLQGVRQVVLVFVRYTGFRQVASRPPGGALLSLFWEDINLFSCVLDGFLLFVLILDTVSLSL